MNDLTISSLFSNESLSPEFVETEMLNGLALGLKNAVEFNRCTIDCENRSRSFSFGYLKGYGFNVAKKYFLMFGDKSPDDVLNRIYHWLQAKNIAKAFFKKALNDKEIKSVLGNIYECSQFIGQSEFGDDELVKASSEVPKGILNAISLALEHDFLN